MFRPPTEALMTRLLLLLCLSWGFFILGTHPLQSSQRQALLRLRQQLHYPKPLEIWNHGRLDFCHLPPSASLSLACQNHSVTQLRIVGDNASSIPLPRNFSIDSLVTTLARLTALRVLALVSLGIWGPLPDKIHRLPQLESLDLAANFLSAPLPPKISSLTRLRNLTLHNNFINGELPDLSGFISLRTLDLRQNKLNSSLPAMPRGLVMAVLSHNYLSGVIPKEYAELSHLHHLDLSFNLLSGRLSDHIICGINLGFIDISNNRLTGVAPPCLGTERNNRYARLAGNCLAKSLEFQHQESYCLENPVKKKHRIGQSWGVLMGVLGGIVFIALVLGYGFLVTCRRYCPRGASEQHLLHKAVQRNSASGVSIQLATNSRAATMLDTEDLPRCRSFSMEELKDATLNFDKSTYISEGSNGKLYKGILEDGTQVVIRRLPLLKKYATRNLKLRLDLLAKLRHPHLVCLLGYCVDINGQDELNRVLLVYEYASKGDFQTLLAESNPEKALAWSERLAILIGVAKAVHFLHTGIIPGLQNNRLKTVNILLSEHGIAKLSDYGLSIIMEYNNKHEVKGEGSLESWPAENLEDDVYSFGLILLDSIVGPSVCKRKREFLQSSLSSQDDRRRIVDPFVLGTSSEDSLNTAISISRRCISPDASPTSFDDVLWNLQYAAQLQTTANAG